MTISHTMRRALGALLVLAVAGMPACATAITHRPLASMDTTACDAVAAAIDSLVVGSNAVRVGLVDETTPRREPHLLPAEWKSLADMPGLDSSTLRSFREHNARALPSCATLPLVGGMTRVARAELATLPRRDVEAYWRTFHARYPGIAGITSTSGVGVGKDGRQALLMLDHGCGGLCGAGHIVLLERDDDGKWRVKRAWMMWVS